MNANSAEPAEERSGWVRALPNLLTSIRLVLGLVFPVIPTDLRWPALLIATATEFLDGQVARLLRVSSATGRILDPIADKIFVFSVLATLTWEGTLLPWQLILIASRDIIVMAGALWVAVWRGPSALNRMPPTILGKSVTAAQFVLLITALANQEVNVILLIATSVLSLAAGIDYVIRFH